MIRKLLWLALVFFLAVLPASAQFTIVTGGPVIDLKGFPYVGPGAEISAQLVVPGGVAPTLNGLGFTGVMFPVGLDSTAHFIIRLADNAVIQPAGTKWNLHVTIHNTFDPVDTGPQTCDATLIITGASMDVSSSFNACPNLTRIPIGGLGPLCTVNSAGAWDVNPQTCAGEKTIQGFAGNPTIKNFTILPASDQTVTNLYSGDPFSSFTNISSFSFFGDVPLTNSFNVGSVFNRTNAASPIAAGLLGYNEDHGSSANPLFGMRCVGYESGVQAGTVQACEGEAYFSGTGVVPILDAFSAFAQMSGTGTVNFQTGFYASANKNTSGATSHVQRNFGYFSESQAGVGINNYEIFLTTGATGSPPFFVNADTGHVNIPVFETARLKHVCLSTNSLDTNATDVLATCLQDTPGAFSTIGTCNAGNEGGLAAVTDSTTNVWGATITGGGANHVLAYCDGTNWTVAAK